MEQTVTPPSEADLAQLAKQRDWVRGHFEPENQYQYDDYAQKLKLLNAIIVNQWIEPHETWRLQSLGVTLGDALVQRHDFEWVTVDDEYGSTAAIRLPGTSIILFPITMISKRIERGEQVDVYEVLRGVLHIVADIKQRETSV